ncbi:MAG: DNA translocase FtsK 4TM domain-containing protein [Elusimicrobiota bacterium]|nr:DNA translocase FtsK 4TM domain-containing protein [Elusimicrobiota bacterium]
MATNRYRSAAKATKSSKARKDILPSALRWAAFFLGAVYLGWALLFPALSGVIGQHLSEFLFRALGSAAYLLPAFMFNGLLQHVLRGKSSGWISTTLASAFGLLSGAALASQIGGWMGVEPSLAGGSVGAAVGRVLGAGLGGPGEFIAGLGVFLFSLQVCFEIQWSSAAQAFAKLLAEDWQALRQARGELKELKAKAPSSDEAAKTKSKAPKPVEDKPAAPPPPKAVDTRAVKPLAGADGGALPKLIEDKAPKAKPAADGGARPAAPAPAAYKDYKAPPLDLLRLPSDERHRGKPTEAEIAQAVADLERTLKSFEIDAHVSGYAPGPVITRYEVTPAPGVKVSSIVALENDIALAMKAKGIRIVAPIPGKAAVGIELPNPRQASVVLREILQSEAMPASAPLLSFGLGLSASGEPQSADIAKMPHVLVAGATGSGKSVLIHSMVLSILYRARPDEVKLLLIDPKRTELTFYEGIPHLFDPCVDPARVSVITSPKDAAKSLKALVSLMEKRYERLQLHGVRNIEGYNAVADKKGLPRDFYIVVVIDELADLMLIAGDIVEDAIQRLTQMARAVGIHLVLATQRPSVDVITGVIKANLPSRIALQVISKIDSKVILDCTGAEALQGRGDLLYLSSGAQKPERCQGAFVSEDEIRSIVEHLKAQGKPDYPMLETMAAKDGAAADLSKFGVEPLEFSQALKLILERRRVSQDLLKSQFGSSARATNILSALEVKAFIHKPEGSNRWEIHFDEIESYMRSHFPQVPLDLKD